MPHRAVVAAAALVAALALVSVPGPAGSRGASTPLDLQSTAFSRLLAPASALPELAPVALDKAARSAGFLGSEAALVEPGSAPKVPRARPVVIPPDVTAARTWKPPKYSISGWATFYDFGTTAMRLPRGTVIRICGASGCIERVVNDYGPVKTTRVVDMYRPDFFQICGCGSWAGTAWVTVSIY